MGDSGKAHLGVDLELIGLAPEPIGITRSGRFVYANRAWGQLLGYPDGEALRGVHAASLLPRQDLPVIEQREALLMASREPLPRRVYRTRRVDGTEVELEVSSVYCEFEGAPAVLSVARDITARRTLERQLVQADRLAAIGTMTAGVAHEINNPLAYVLLNLEWVTRTLRSAADPPSLEHLTALLEDARHGVEHVAMIVRGLKSFSRGDTETLMAVDLQAVAESAIKIAGHEVRRRATLQTAFEPAPPVFANDARLEQVVVNLLINAAQAMTGHGSPSNAIRVGVAPSDGDRVSLEVSDNGSGIPADVLPRIFDPFFTTKPIGVGTGLGLSICHSIVTSLGGTIVAHSEPGKGTTFQVTLPVAHLDALLPDTLASAPRRTAPDLRKAGAADPPSIHEEATASGAE
jgi:PAS domain S-box-containing protein